jgi:hypothetical protein
MVNPDFAYNSVIVEYVGQNMQLFIGRLNIATVRKRTNATLEEIHERIERISLFTSINISGIAHKYNGLVHCNNFARNHSIVIDGIEYTVINDRKQIIEWAFDFILEGKKPRDHFFSRLNSIYYYTIIYF